jgi:hypothetical protein
MLHILFEADDGANAAAAMFDKVNKDFSADEDDDENTGDADNTAGNNTTNTADNNTGGNTTAAPNANVANNTTDNNAGNNDNGNYNVDTNAGANTDQGAANNAAGGDDANANGGDDNGDDDFTIKTDDVGTSGDNTVGNDNSGDTGGDQQQGGGDTTPDAGADDNQEEDTDSPLKQKERELFDSLSPEEQKMKNAILKKLYVELYDDCDVIIDKFNSVSSDMDKVSIQVKRTLSILFNLKQMINDYFLNIFDSKTYIENDIMFNRYLSILNNVKNVTKGMDSIYTDDAKKGS